MLETEKTGRQSLFVTSLAKGLKVFSAFESVHKELGISEISKITNIEKSATSRIVQTLFKLGFLSRDSRSRKYALTAEVLSIAYSYLRANPIIQTALPRLVGLGDKTGNSIALVIPADTDVIYASRVDRREFYHPSGHIGERQPAYCTSGGRAILSQLPNDVVIDILERSDRRKITPKTTTDIDMILKELEIAREKFYCVQVGEFIRNEFNIAAPVMNAQHEPVAAVIISRLYREEEKDEIEKLLSPLLLHTVNDLSAALGGQL